MFDFVIRGGTVVTGRHSERADVGVSEGRIKELGRIPSGVSDQEIDAACLHILPGVIDTQVHFREPGMEHKEDLESGTRAALHGGVTTIFEMPNTLPTTTTSSALTDKLNRANGRAWCNYAFFVGAASDNLEELWELETSEGTPGVKIFVGSSTGTLLVPDDELLEKVLMRGRYRCPIHSEDHARLMSRSGMLSDPPTVHDHPHVRDAECARLATERVLRLSEKTGRPVHILHLSTADEIPLIEAAKPMGTTVECTPQHLWFSAPECYDRLGTRAQMNPPLRSVEHRNALRDALKRGFFDVVGSDHAPHTLEEKSQPYPKSPSGMPGVQTLLPAMLTLAQRDGLLDIQSLVRLACERPAEIYSIRNKGFIAPGYDADLVLVDLSKRAVFEREMVQSKCGWSPFEGEEFWGWPITVILGGEVALSDGERVGQPAGTVVQFNRERIPAPRF
ncbi:MAG: dihydroorotase [Fimbriimonadaceae bacterium]